MLRFDWHCLRRWDDALGRSSSYCGGETLKLRAHTSHLDIFLMDCSRNVRRCHVNKIRHELLMSPLGLGNITGLVRPCRCYSPRPMVRGSMASRQLTKADSRVVPDL